MVPAAHPRIPPRPRNRKCSDTVGTPNCCDLVPLPIRLLVALGRVGNFFLWHFGEGVTVDQGWRTDRTACRLTRTTRSVSSRISMA